MIPEESVEGGYLGQAAPGLMGGGTIWEEEVRDQPGGRGFRRQLLPPAHTGPDEAGVPPHPQLFPPVLRNLGDAKISGPSFLRENPTCSGFSQLLSIS